MFSKVIKAIVRKMHQGAIAACLILGTSIAYGQASMLEGTAWRGSTSRETDYQFEFMPNGVLRYSNWNGKIVATYENARWKLTSNQLSIDFNNGFANWQGALAGDSLTGNARNKNGIAWTWSFKKINIALAQPFDQVVRKSLPPSTANISPGNSESQSELERRRLAEEREAALKAKKAQEEAERQRLALADEKQAKEREQRERAAAEAKRAQEQQVKREPQAQSTKQSNVPPVQNSSAPKSIPIQTAKPSRLEEERQKNMEVVNAAPVQQQTEPAQWVQEKKEARPISRQQAQSSQASNTILAESKQISCQPLLLIYKDLRGDEISRNKIGSFKPINVYIASNKLRAFYPNQQEKYFIDGADFEKTQDVDGILRNVFLKRNSDGTEIHIQLTKKRTEREINLISTSIDKKLPHVMQMLSACE
jgi:hypothetical protein